MPRPDVTFLRSPQNFRTLLSGLQPAHWPPHEEDLKVMADRCIEVIEAIDEWESATHGRNVVDLQDGDITTAQVRRLLAQEVMISYEGDLAVLLIHGGHGRVAAEIHGDVHEYQGMLKEPSLVLAWEEETGDVSGSEVETKERWFRLKPKGPHWYMLSQLRDDLRENRLTTV